jgi:wobble nucleotide-excising tRNase
MTSSYSSGQESLLAKCAAERAVRRRFLEQNKANVARMMERARESRTRTRQQTDLNQADLRRSLTQSRMAMKREVARTLDQYRSKRRWQKQELQHELAANIREIRREVRRVLRASATERSRQQQQRIRSTADALRAVRRSVAEIRRSVGVAGA